MAAEDPVELSHSPLAQAPAIENPWYVLATICEDSLDQEANYERNCRIWNGWSCSRLSNNERDKVAALSGLPIEMIVPWTNKEMAYVNDQFSIRQMNLPDPGAPVDLRNLRFPSSCLMARFVFSKRIMFDNANFDSLAWFSGATFLEGVSFRNTKFMGFAEFDRATGQMDFLRAVFNDRVRFDSCRGSISLIQSVSEKSANFSSTKINVSFSGALFKGSVDFSRTVFTDHVEFQDTVFLILSIFQAQYLSDRLYFRVVVLIGQSRFVMHDS